MALWEQFSPGWLDGLIFRFNQTVAGIPASAAANFFFQTTLPPDNGLSSAIDDNTVAPGNVVDTPAFCGLRQLVPPFFHTAAGTRRERPGTGAGTAFGPPG